MWYTSSMMSRSPNGHQVESWGKTEKVVEKLRKLWKNWESYGKTEKVDKNWESYGSSNTTAGIL